MKLIVASTSQQIAKHYVNERRMAMNKQERLEAINKLLKFISERGRRFFYTDSNILTQKPAVAFMLLKHGRVYFKDHRTFREMLAYEGRLHDGFSHGGTLWALICEFSYFIRTGEPSNGKYGYGGLYGSGWGHSDEIQQEIIDYAIEIGYLKR